MAEGYQGSLADFTEAFLEDITGYYSPFIHHVLSYWKQRNNHLLFLTYEEMKADLPSVVKKVAKFLGKPLPESQESMKTFLDHLSFDKMKYNTAVNKDDFMKVKLLHTHYFGFYGILYETSIVGLQRSPWTWRRRF